MYTTTINVSEEVFESLESLTAQLEYSERTEDLKHEELKHPATLDWPFKQKIKLDCNHVSHNQLVA